MTVAERLLELQDLKYRDFNSKLIPSVDPELVIGVRTPELRKFAREFAKDSESAVFLGELPHKYYEENCLHAFVIEQIKDFDTAVKMTEEFLPYIDNWATCDMFFPKIFSKNADALLPLIKKWIKSDKTYTVRYAIGLLMRMYLDDKFSEEYLALVASVKSEEYYINMMIAWYFATALAKQYDSTIPYIAEKRLSPWIHNKSIQKSIESRRISADTKAYLRTLKIKVSAK